MIGSALAQDINRYRVLSDTDLFQREWARMTARTPALPSLPMLDCAVEYIRRSEGKDIVFRRGPIPLEQHHVERRPTEGQPETGSVTMGSPSFIGGLLVDRPRAGEAFGWLSTASDERKYMVRVAMVPISYENAVLHAWIVLERAEVSSDSTTVTVLHSEVFSHEAYLRGNEPMHFPLPVWEQDSSSIVGIPSVLEEGVLITLETPRFFGFSQNVPEPFSDGTAITYAVPKKSHIRLSIRVKDRDEVVDAGVKDAGRYRVVWEPTQVEDGSYQAILTAEDSTGSLLHESALPLTKERRAASLHSGADHGSVTRPPNDQPLIASVPRFRLGLAGGVAYQLPGDQELPLRNMFTHLALRLGYRLSETMEAGLMMGQDAFHETPNSSIDIDRIDRYGGVVGYSYAYLGVYVQRVSASPRTLGTAARLSFLLSSEAPITEAGFGLVTEILGGLRIMLMPTVMMHLRSEISTKLGLEYSAQVRF